MKSWLQGGKSPLELGRFQSDICTSTVNYLQNPMLTVTDQYACNTLLHWLSLNA